MTGPAASQPEAARLAAVRALALLDTPPEERFDRIVRLACRVLRTPIALIALVDATRVWFKARQGTDLPEVPRNGSFCHHAVQSDRTLLVRDAARDPRFTTSPLVTGPPGARFYAGQPLHGPQGLPVGTLCVMDRRPRAFRSADVQALRDLAAWAEAELGRGPLRAEGATPEQVARTERARREFVSVLSHEVRTALTGIQGFSEMMRDEEFSLAEMKEFAADIHQDAVRLDRLIGDLLELDRLESGRAALQREPVDLNAVVADAVAAFRREVPTPAVAVVLDPAGPVARGDRDRLVQAVTHLLSNAAERAPVGTEITVSTRVADAHAQVCVRDEGPPIPPDALARVFERVGRSERAPGARTGLGLLLVRQIVHLHGGRAWAESAPGEATTFLITVPVVTQ